MGVQRGSEEQGVCVRGCNIILSMDLLIVRRFEKRYLANQFLVL